MSDIVVSDIVICKRCKTQLGKIVLIGELEFLLLNGVLCRQVHGVCAKCGLEFHWSVSDRKLIELINKVQ